MDFSTRSKIIMGPALISRTDQYKSAKFEEDQQVEKLLQLHQITQIAELKLKKLTRREIVETTKDVWFVKDPTVAQNNSKLTMCPFPNCEFKGVKTQLKLHKLKSHRTIAPYKCEQPGCKYASNQNQLLVRHTEQLHKIVRPEYFCTHHGCDFKSSFKPNFKNHLIKVHGEKPYVCETCQKCYSTMNQLKYHMMTHSSANKRSCTFPNCDYKYLPHYSAAFKKHLMTHTDEKPHKCPYCSWRSRSTKSLKLHMQLHQDQETRARLQVFKCTFNNCNYSSNQNSNLQTHIKTHSAIKPFKCTWSQCNFAARSNWKLNDHMKTHSNDKPFICNFCNLAYSTSCRLVIHVRSHTGEKPYKCSYKNCQYSAAEPSAITSHIKIHHSKLVRERNHACVLCSKSFYVKNDLQCHMRTHTGERPYSCQYCKRGFTVSGASNVHERRCKMRPDCKTIQPYKCQFCEKGFVVNIEKLRHEMCCKMREDGKVIKPYICQYCAKDFTWRSSIRDHQKRCRFRVD